MMKVCHYPEIDLPEGVQPPVTLGNFDGVHLGHQRAMALLRDRASVLGAPSVVLTFEPHPVSVLRPEEAPKRILGPAQKEEVIASLGLDYLVVIAFTLAFSRVEPETFVSDILVDRLRVSELVLGSNFRFGRGRAGDLDALRRMGEAHGFIVHEVEASIHEGEMISSSRIRRSLAEGRIEEAAAMLGRPYFVDGEVVRGDGRGRLMGFPTANVRTRGDLLVGDGVYVTEAEISGRRYRGMTHVGLRPTFGLTARTVETHLFDFDEEIYDCPLRLFFHRRVRGTVAFESAEALREQLERDREEARGFFRSG